MMQNGGGASVEAAQFLIFSLWGEKSQARFASHDSLSIYDHREAFFIHFLPTGFFWSATCVTAESTHHTHVDLCIKFVELKHSSPWIV
jgi:hypothetical protein